jgi:hypothetical protein
MADVITGSQLDSTKMAKIAQIAQRELEAAAVVRPTCMDISSLVAPGDKSVDVSKLTSFTATNRGEGTAVDAAALTSSNDTLLLDEVPTVKYVIDSYSALQYRINAEIEYAQRAGSALARYVDNTIITELEAGKGDSVNAVAADIDKDAILDMREYLIRNNGNKDNFTLLLPPDQEKVMLGIAEFTRADIYGTSNIPNGMIGRVYGVNVLISNLMPVQQAYMYESSAIALAFQREVRRDSEKNIDYGTGAERVVFDAVFGVKSMQTAKGVKLDGSTPNGAGESALIVGLNA